MNEIGIISTEAAEETRVSSQSMQDMALVADEMLQAIATFKLGDEDEPVVVAEPDAVSDEDGEAVDLAFLLSEESQTS